MIAPLCYDPNMILNFCPCGSEQATLNCCGRYIDGSEHAPTPEALMRSRYTAYTQGKIAYIVATQQGPGTQGFDSVSSEQWAKNVSWQKLEVKRAWMDKNDENHGFVDFCAYYQEGNQNKTLAEVSEFRFQKGQWFYLMQ